MLIKKAFFLFFFSIIKQEKGYVFINLIVCFSRIFFFFLLLLLFIIVRLFLLSEIVIGIFPYMFLFLQKKKKHLKERRKNKKKDVQTLIKNLDVNQKIAKDNWYVLTFLFSSEKVLNDQNTSNTTAQLFFFTRIFLLLVKYTFVFICLYISQGYTYVSTGCYLSMCRISVLFL